MSSFTIKPLVWVERANTILTSNAYRIGSSYGQGPEPFMVSHGSNIIGWSDSEEGCKRVADQHNRVLVIAAIATQPDPRDEVKPHLRLSIARKIGMYGAAYDGPYDARAYTYEHQPGNEPAWNIGKAASNAAKDTAGDYIDGGLSLLRHLSDEGFGVFALNKHAALDVQPDPRDAQIAALVEAAQDYVNRSEEYQIISTDRGGSHGPKGKAFIAVGNAYNAMVAALAAVKGGDA